MAKETFRKQRRDIWRTNERHSEGIPPMYNVSISVDKLNARDLMLHGMILNNSIIIRMGKFYKHFNVLTFKLLIMIVEPLPTAWNQTRRRVTRHLVTFQAVCHSANMSSKF